MDSIIFDLDGTIWDPIDTVLKAWNQVIIDHKGKGKELRREDLEAVMGKQKEEIAAQLFPHLSKHEGDQLLEECFEKEQEHIENHGGRLFPNVENVLAELSKKYKLFIVSNCQDGYIESFYQFHSLDGYFIDYENPGRTGLSKGKNIALIIERNSLKSPVYVGDTDGDLQAAAYAGIPFVYAAYGFGQVEAPVQQIEAFEDLLKWV
ncbi:HAD family hydrolase [Halobacillus salinarum]|uniref:HAD family hydrolase n=1 Tax=Halobacillus salinarum TaxID=2932257 RepID=A0ABY4EN37_9BACI|nr:HAD family hydrolase [Halobacillus salinarum]UOQ45604.1 HAD family hydrolase [Halobacillus salinarum]